MARQYKRDRRGRFASSAASAANRVAGTRRQRVILSTGVALSAGAGLAVGRKGGRLAAAQTVGAGTALTLATSMGRPRNKKEAALMGASLTAAGALAQRAEANSYFQRQGIGSMRKIRKDLGEYTAPGFRLKRVRGGMKMGPAGEKIHRRAGVRPVPKRRIKLQAEAARTFKASKAKFRNSGTKMKAKADVYKTRREFKKIIKKGW